MSQGFFRTKVPFPAEEMGKGNPTPVREKVLEKYKNLNETALQGGYYSWFFELILKMKDSS